MITRICAGLIGKLMMALVSVLCLSGFSLAASPDNTKLTGAYFRLLEAGAAQVEARLNAEPSATLETLEALPGWSHFPYCILASAVLYSKKHSANPRYHDPKMLTLTPYTVSGPVEVKVQFTTKATPDLEPRVGIERLDERTWVFRGKDNY